MDFNYFILVLGNISAIFCMTALIIWGQCELSDFLYDKTNNMTLSVGVGAAVWIIPVAIIIAMSEAA